MISLSRCLGPLPGFTSRRIKPGQRYINFGQRQDRLEGNPRAHVFKADLVGLNKDDARVELEEVRVLQIRGERIGEHEEKNVDKWHHVERSVGKFVRSFRLPKNAKVDEMKATMENGVLIVTVPKEQVQNPKTKPIDIVG